MVGDRQSAGRFRVRNRASPQYAAITKATIETALIGMPGAYSPVARTRLVMLHAPRPSVNPPTESAAYRANTATSQRTSKPTTTPAIADASSPPRSDPPFP